VEGEPRGYVERVFEVEEMRRMGRLRNLQKQILRVAHRKADSAKPDQAPCWCR